MKMLANPADLTQVEAHVSPLATVWAIIEARQTFPALIAVASATDMEDTEPVARGLAHASHESGKRTGYLYLGRARRPAREQAHEYTDFSFDAHRTQRQSFDSSSSAWHATYEVIIVEVPQLASCTLGAHVARVADGIVVAVHPGRKVMPADRELRVLFNQLHSSIIGVVKTGAVSPVATSLALRGSLSSLFFPVRQQ